MIKLKHILTITGALLFYVAICQENQSTDSTKTKKKETIKTGWTFGAVPALAFDTDVGFKYGGVINFFYYGDGTTYPKYWHSLYLEWSRTTKGSGINQIILDSDSLLKKVRTYLEFSYLTENLLDFYGYNGYNAFYDPVIEDIENAGYLSRLYYRQERKLLRLRSEFLGKIKNSPFKWFAGLEYTGVRLDTINLGKVNDGKEPDEMVPASNGGLFGKYKEWGLLPEDQYDGGFSTLLKAGLVYDTRDNEANPNRGMWTELQYMVAPGFISDGYGYSKLVFIHRHYITLLPKRLTFAYRLSYQGKLTGEMPSYMLPFFYNNPPSQIRDGLGGNKTIRGVMRNRVVGEDYILGNVELRWKFYQTVVLKQNLYLALNLFFDSGRILKEYKLQESTDAEAIQYLNSGRKDTFHNGAGTGLKVVLNDNFIVSFDYGLALDENDGDSGFYMGLNFLF